MLHKPRLPRVEREGDVEFKEDENQHLWAVSYADFLMALLAFFILFFSMDDPKRDDLIHTLSAEFKKAAITTASAPEQRAPTSLPQLAMSESLLERLRILNIHLINEGTSLVVQFPENYFGPGKYRIDQGNQASINTLLDVIAPFKDRMNIYFEGHSDQEPVKKARTGMLTDNFVLSSLRATSALQYARQKGFPENHLYITAMGSNSRNSRTLSLRLEARTEHR